MAWPSSLVRQRRGTRSGRYATYAVGMSKTRALCRAAQWIRERWGWECGGVTPAAVWTRVRGPIHWMMVAAEVEAPVGGGDGRTPASMDDRFVDAVEGTEVAAMLAVCGDVRERLLVCLSGRLGMRIGAIRALRLPGVLATWPMDPGSADPWRVRDTIAAWDKGDRVNHFRLALCPGLDALLREYLVTFWRPRYGGDADATPRCLFLFPGRYWRERPDRPVSVRRASQWIVDVMRRAGIVGPRAHTHALRKGFCTELLRAGNPPEVVARVMHHRSAQTTGLYYDKRSETEILGTIVPPVAWNADPSASPAPDAEPAGDAATLRRRLRLLESLLGDEARTAYQREASMVV